MALERLPELLNVDVVEHALHRDLLLADGLDSARVDAGEPVREGLLLLGAVKQLRGLLVRVRKAALDVDRDDRDMVEDRCVRLEQAPRPRQHVRGLQQHENVAAGDDPEQLAQVYEIIAVQKHRRFQQLREPVLHLPGVTGSLCLVVADKGRKLALELPSCLAHACGTNAG